MILQKAIDIFQVLFDKYGSPGQSTPEVVDMLNMAINEYLNRLFPDSQGGVINYELDSNTVSNLLPLIWTVQVNMDAAGLVTNAVLEAAVRAKSGDAACKVFRVGSIGIVVAGKTYPVKFTKQNAVWANERNVFKRPGETSAGFTVSGEGFHFRPAQPTSPLVINVVKTPKVLSAAATNVEMELPDYVIYNVISIALKLAGISVRDTELLEDTRLASLQISQ